MSSITDTYEMHAKQFPNKIAIHTMEQKISYQEWSDTIKKTALWLDTFQGSNETIGIFLPNGIPFLQFFAGAAAAGWISVLFDPKWNVVEIEKRLKISRPSILITSRKLKEKIQHLDTNIIVLEDFLETLQKIDIIPRKMIDSDFPFYMGFTSGTTGDPKAFIRSQHSWLASFQANVVDFQMNEQDLVLIPGALIHSHFLYGAISTLFLGGTVFLLEKFTPKQALSIIDTHPITTVFVVPTMIQAFIKENKRVTKPIKLISSGAKWEVHSKDQIQNLFPYLSRYEFYGASELSFVTVLTDQEHQLKPSSVGRPCFGVELQIRHENQELANPLEIGKIFIRSNMLFRGYLHASSDKIHCIADSDGWVTVDDMGYIDEDGYLYLVGREKNMILYGGINLFPEEIEKVISSHAKVKEVAVVGIKDEYWGQIACAVVIGEVTKTELIRFCKTSLSSFKIPRKWVFTNEMPYTISGKIARVTLKEQLESKVICHE